MNLEKIQKKYCNQQYNDRNYSIGGGLDNCRFASNRHEDARHDDGKLTEGQATQLFKKATGEDLQTVKNVINYAFPNMEWHHAGKLPKAYGGGMKKTYFLNAEEICDLATNWNSYLEKYQISIQEQKTAAEKQRDLEAKKQKFLSKYAERVVRVSTKPEYFYQTAQEMNGKYGWFDSYGKYYTMTEYFSGWKFKNAKHFNQFNQIL